MDAALVRLRELLADNDVALLDLVNRRLLRSVDGL